MYIHTYTYIRRYMCICLYTNTMLIITVIMVVVIISISISYVHQAEPRAQFASRAADVRQGRVGDAKLVDAWEIIHMYVCVYIYRERDR